MGTSLPIKASTPDPKGLGAPPQPESAAPFAHSGTEDGGRSNAKMRRVTDLRGETGRFQGYNDGKFFREEVTPDENPRRREAHGVEGGGRELEPQRPLNPCHADSALSAIRGYRLCQDVQGAQICRGNRSRVMPGHSWGTPCGWPGLSTVRNPCQGSKGWGHDHPTWACP